MIIEEAQKLSFLTCGGETGKLIRSKDWNHSLLGNPENWPLTLRTLLSLTLNANIPMVLFWGPRHTCFYNDACLQMQALTGRYSETIGQPGQHCWPEIWDTMKPLIDNALVNGVAGRVENLYLPVFRNGHTGDQYWTFSFNPVRDEKGMPAGVWVACTEAPGPVSMGKNGAESETNFRNIILHSPIAMCLLKGPSFLVDIANERMFELWGKPAEELIEKPIFDSLPEAAAQGMLEIMKQVYDTGEPFIAKELAILLPRNGIIETVYLNFIYEAFRGTDGIITGIMAVAVDVTDQVLARMIVEESSEKYRNLIATMDQGFCIIDMIFDTENNPRDYRFLDTNPVFETQTGLVDAVGKTALELIPNLESHWFERYGKVALTGIPSRFVEGSAAMKRWFEVYAFKIGSSDSHRVALLFTDISERRLAEEVRNQSEQNLRNIMLQAPVAMAVFKGEDLQFNVVNKIMLDLLGKTDEIKGKPLLECLPELKGQPILKFLYRVFRTGKSHFGHEALIQLERNGIREDHFFNFTYTALVEEDKVAGVMVVANDVSDLVTARMKLEESNKEFRLVTDTMPQIIWITKPDGYHDFYNQQWYDYTGLSFDKSKDTGWSLVVHPDDQERAWEVWRYSLNTMEPYQIEYRFRRFDGEYRWFLGRALPLKDDAGKVLKWFGTLTDIDDQKKAADLMEEKVKERTTDLRSANADLKRVNEELEQLTYVSHHDLQEPLRKIMIFSEMVKNEHVDRLPKASINRLDKVTDAAKTMSKALKDVLDFASLSKKEEFTKVDLDDVLAAVIADLEGVITEKNAKIISETLPVIQAISGQVYKLLYNLVMNALKFSTPGVPPEIRIKCSQEQESKGNIGGRRLFYEISVKDNGIGFSPNLAEKIFIIFQRLHAKDGFEGTGIGLAICKKVVANHGGTIWAESQPNEGATFKILLPVE